MAMPPGPEFSSSGFPKSSPTTLEPAGIARPTAGPSLPNPLEQTTAATVHPVEKQDTEMNVSHQSNTCI